MWTIIKHKRKEQNIMINNLKKSMGDDTLFYFPKIIYEKKIKNKVKRIIKPILGNYLFCFNKHFSDRKFSFKLKYTKGLDYFLDGYVQNQSNISKFIDFCKNYENDEGSLKQSFFKVFEKNKVKFINGPLSNVIFEILEKKKQITKGSLGSMTVTIKNNSNLFFSQSY